MWTAPKWNLTITVYCKSAKCLIKFFLLQTGNEMTGMKHVVVSPWKGLICGGTQHVLTNHPLYTHTVFETKNKFFCLDKNTTISRYSFNNKSLTRSSNALVSAFKQWEGFNKALSSVTVTQNKCNPPLIISLCFLNFIWLLPAQCTRAALRLA